MIFIVAGHSVLHGGVEMPLTVNGIFAFGKISLKSVIMSALPISTSQYWFATCYVILLLISPALQIFIHN